MFFFIEYFIYIYYICIYSFSLVLMAYCFYLHEPCMNFCDLTEKPVQARDILQWEAPTFVVLARDEETVVGKTVVLRCKAKGVPLPQFKWYKNDKRVIPDRQVTVGMKDNGETTLTIVNVLPVHDGTYTCVATSAAGSAKTKAELFVDGL